MAQFFVSGQLLNDDTLYDAVRALPAAASVTYDVKRDLVVTDRYRPPQDHVVPMRMSPRDPFIVVALTGTAFGHFLAGQHDQAAKWAEQAFREYPNYFFANVVCACTRAVTGRADEACAVMARVRDMNSTLRVSNLRDLEPLRQPKDLVIWANAMRRAGLPQ